MGHKIKLPAPKTSTFLRIQVSDSGVTQMQYAPGISTNPGYGFILLFRQGTLADANDKPLERGYLGMRIRPSAVSPFDLALLSRLLQPFKGYFEMDVMGTYTAQQVSPTENVIEVLVDSILVTDIQPT